MADIVITVTAEGVPFPFQGRLVGAEGTDLPRGKVVFEGSAVITAKIATNTTTLIINCELPQNFAYSLNSGALSLLFPTATADAAHWTDALVTFFPDGSGLPRISTAMGVSDQAASGNLGSAAVYFPLSNYRDLFFNSNANTPLVAINISDNDAVNATVAGTVFFCFSFLQYDIAQVFNQVVNSPIPVRTV